MVERAADVERELVDPKTLRDAKLLMMKRRNREHPYFWAGLIASGEWANLDGMR